MKTRGRSTSERRRSETGPTEDDPCKRDWEERSGVSRKGPGEEKSEI